MEKFDNFSRESFDGIKKLISVSSEAVIGRCAEPRFHAREVTSELRALRELLVLGFMVERDQPILTERQARNTYTIAKRHKDFLETLAFRGMDEREESIPTAHHHTYEWLVEDPDEHRPLGVPSPYHRAKKALKRDVVLRFKERGIDLSTRKYPFSFPETPSEPTAHFQRWLLSGRGTL